MLLLRAVQLEPSGFYGFDIGFPTSYLILYYSFMVIACASLAVQTHARLSVSGRNAKDSTYVVSNVIICVFVSVRRLRPSALALQLHVSMAYSLCLAPLIFTGVASMTDESPSPNIDLERSRTLLQEHPSLQGPANESRNFETSRVQLMMMSAS
ncbi:hypothetical protein BDV98DRAFT_566108 [Pterulicium gracile]|uniref:Uncharacterized protein n=1 Tax=Pterulicium gracile TaxID=1884261 RepID=A0A5C3QP57_9AGAR|nr:hypothetical protein BDV98DRAFT_566108 [Pterula gracilis]